MKEWQIKLPSGKCPHVKLFDKCGYNYVLDFTKNELPKVKCSFENCPIKVEEPNENT